MVETKIDIAQDVRAKVSDRLNEVLANGIDLQLQIKQAHWNVKGSAFIAVHKMFDELREDVDEYVDTVAERVVQLGGTAGGTIKVVAEGTTLPPYPLKAVDWTEHVEAISKSLADFGSDVRKGIDETDDWGDKGSVDVLTEVSRGIDKWTWFVSAHLQGKR